MFDNDSYLICGDFNLVLNPNIDYDNYKRTNNRTARNIILENIDSRQLTDTFREM